MTQEEFKAISVEKLPESEVKISGEIPYTYLHAYRKHAVEHVGAGVEIDGFRKGHVPENILIARVGEMALLNDMAEHSLEDAYVEIVKEHKLDVIGHPKISITKLAKDNPLGFSITVSIMPEVVLPEYKSIASEVNKHKDSKEVSDEDITKQIEEILRQKVAYERLQANAQKNAEKSDSEIKLTIPESTAVSEDTEGASKLPPPELTDEYVKTLGKPGQFETVTDFRSKIREHLSIEKAKDVDSHHRAKITDAITEKATIDLPQILIDVELGQMFAQMEDDLARAQLKIDDYLEHIKKTKDGLKKEWTPAALKRAKLQLVLNAIAKKEGTKPDTGRVDHEVSHLLEQHKDADERRVRIYVESVLTNDAVLEMLERA